MEQSRALAQVARGVVDVRLEVERGCLFVADPRADGAAALGVLDFGRHARLDGPAAGPPTAILIPAHPSHPSPAYLECNPGTAYRFEVDAGVNGGAGDVRHLAPERAHPEGAWRATIPYRLFTDPAWRTPLEADVPVPGLVPSGGRVTLPLYARIDPRAVAPAVGAYSDTLRVTLTW